MMAPTINQAFIAGYERLVSWSDLLDQINVFPVADGDTGRNLKISLAPIRGLDGDRDDTIRRLLRSATGNSGNIANLFFSKFLTAVAPDHLLPAAVSGRDAAWQAVVDPQPGTILTVLDTLVSALKQTDAPLSSDTVSVMLSDLEQAVLSTTDMLPSLAAAGVVDAGALAMFIYLEGFFLCLTDRMRELRSITDVFAGRLRIDPDYAADVQDGYCVDTLVRVAEADAGTVAKLAAWGDSVVVSPAASMLKIHLHTSDRQAVRQALESIGEVVDWSDERIEASGSVTAAEASHRAVHIMTDAAGSVTKADARDLGMTLLDSYLMIGDRVMPETLFRPEDLYPAMRRGVKVSTSQASNFERHQCYASALNRFEHVLYLCVGSVYTGNYAIAEQWREANDKHGRMTIIDTTAASGRLGVIAMATARRALETSNRDDVVDFARRAVARSREYVFLDRLKYLVAGGRLSKTSGFFGDLLHMKPVISPTAEGAKKMGVVRNRTDQVHFAIGRLKDEIGAGRAPFIMLEYSDNLDWVTAVVEPKIRMHCPAADIVRQPLSLTSGAHMGPGTWGIAYLTDE